MRLPTCSGQPTWSADVFDFAGATADPELRIGALTVETAEIHGLSGGAWEWDRDNRIRCGKLAKLRLDLRPSCNAHRPAHVPYVGNWRTGKGWPI